MTKRTPPEGYETDTQPDMQYGQAESWYRLVGPLYYAQEDEPGQKRVAFFAEQRYISSMGRVHGGKMSSFMDYLLFSTARPAWGETALATVSLNINFVSACPPGVWVYGKGEVVRAGKNMAFVTGEAVAEGRTIVHATGTFRKL